MNVELLKTFYETAPLSMQCNQSDGTRFPVSLQSFSNELAGVEAMYCGNP